MRNRHALSLAALALVAVASTARAQGPAARATAAAPTTAAATPWTAKSAGTYDILVAGTGNDDHAEPATLVIGADSTGALTAKVVEGPRNDEHPMTVEVKGDDLVMKSQTNNGIMTITVQRHGDALAGHWEIGMQQGTLTGKLHS
ncbi:MAG TPA: hypothetical protein VF761_12085 [Gemmatimonadaceae bacterium]